MPSTAARAVHYYIPLATSPSLAQSPLVDDEETARSSSPHSTPTASPAATRSCFGGFACSHSTRSSLLSSRRALLFAGLVSLLTLVVVSSVLERRNLSARVDQVVSSGHKAVDAVWEAGAELRQSTTGIFSDDDAEEESGAVPFAGQDFIASQADTGSPLAKAQDDGAAGSSATPGNPDMLDHALLSDPPAATAAQTVCTPEMQIRVNNASFWTVKQDEPLRYLIAAAQDSTLRDPVPPSCLAHAVFSARLVSLATTSGDDKIDRLDPPESQTLVALERPVWQSDTSAYELRIPELPTLPSRRYELEVRLEFGYYPGLEDGVPCGAEAATCSPAGILAAAEGQGDLRYLGDKVAIASGATLNLPDREISKDESVPMCTDLSSLTGYYSNLSYYPTSPACSLAIPTLPLPDAFFAPGAAAADNDPTSSPPQPPLWINIVGDSNSRNAYKRFIDSLGGGFHGAGPMVMDSKTHNGTLAGLAFRYRDGVPPADETKQVPDVVVTWMWWYQVAHSDELEQNRDELLSFVDTDLATFLTTAKLDSTHQHFPLLREAARGVRPHRTYLSLGSHGETLSVPGVATSLDALLSETDGLFRQKRDTANLRLVTTTLVNTRHIPLARFPHQDLVRTNALIHAKNVYAARHRPEFAHEGRVLDVEALTRGIVEQDEWMKQSKRGPDAVHFRTDVYDEWVRILWTDVLAGASGQTDSRRVATASEARKRWKRRLPPQELEDVEF